MDSMRKPRAYVNLSLSSHVTAEGLVMPMAAPRTTCVPTRPAPG